MTDLVTARNETKLAEIERQYQQRIASLEAEFNRKMFDMENKVKSEIENAKRDQDILQSDLERLKNTSTQNRKRIEIMKHLHKESNGAAEIKISEMEEQIKIFEKQQELYMKDKKRFTSLLNSYKSQNADL